MVTSETNGTSSVRPNENAPHGAGHYLSLVARGGIDQGRGYPILYWPLVNLALPCTKSFLPAKFTAKETIAVNVPVTIASVV